MTGLDYLQAVASGDLPAPPIAKLMNFEFLEVEKGQVIFGVQPAEYHYNPLGAVHGGLPATLVDSATTCAVLSTAPIGVNFTTVELHINYIRPITTKTGYLRCIGKVIHAGRRMATAEAKLVDERSKLYAHATTTCLAVPMKQS
jgi:uncharacterized protein (TIGR00369 family)